MDMVRGALWIGETTRDQLTEEAVTLSGLDNPNSVKQLTQWLEEELDEELTDLRKDTVSRLLNGNMANDTARRMLEIRQELGKTSTKKYNAIEAAVCADGRVRGLLQFYGANRTGRWAGRLVQVQNLPRTYVEPLPLARDLVKRRETASLRALFGSVPDTLSQLIRTSFIAEPGNALVDADFQPLRRASYRGWPAKAGGLMYSGRTAKFTRHLHRRCSAYRWNEIKKAIPNTPSGRKARLRSLRWGTRAAPAH